MTILLLIRHAHTPTAGKRLTGWAPGVHLSEEGRAQAERLAERLDGVPLAAIYSSPLERCRETAAPLATAHGLPTRVRRELIEVGYGDWTGRSIAQLARTKLWRSVQAAPSTVRFPGGESLADVQSRAVDEVRRIAEAHPDHIVAVISHADVIRLTLAQLAGIHLDLYQRLVVDPASVSAVGVGSGPPRIWKVNETGDLSGLVPARTARRRSRRAKVGG
jgi:probable phosphoglycerate mutase